MKLKIKSFRAAALLLLALVLTACAFPRGPEGDEAGGNNGGERISVIASSFPQYDWLRRIIGENNEHVDLALLVKGGVDLHSFQPTVKDIAAIANSDMFVYVGGVSDAWVEKALENAVNKDVLAISMIEALGGAVMEEGIDEDIGSRPLSDWQGEWQSIEGALEAGFLDEYIAHQSAGAQDMASARENYARRWKSDYAFISIEDGSASFGGSASAYGYIGHIIAQSDQGSILWHGFEAESPGVPRYIALSDGLAESSGSERLLPHFCLRYGDESFEALTGAENWLPIYFKTEATGEEIARTMEGRHHSHDHDHDHEVDEHVWLSLKNARILCGHFAQALSRLDPKNAELYLKNAADYEAELAALDSEYQRVADSAKVKALLFGDRFPFRYLMDDYGIDYYAAFPSCSAETEASFETIAFLAGKMDELNLGCVLAIDGSDQSIARTIVQSGSAKNQRVLVMDSMQSISDAAIASGATYLSIMEGNLEVLKQALKAE